MPRPAANMNVAKKIGDVEVYEDLQNLPDDVAVKKSLARLRNQRAKTGKGEGGGEKKPRKARTPSAGAIARSGAVAMPAEARGIMERHQREVAEHEKALRDMLERHEAELTRVRQLAEFIAMGDKIGGDAGSADLTAAARKELAAIK